MQASPTLWGDDEPEKMLATPQPVLVAATLPGERNPCIVAFGAGLAGVTCANCTHLHVLVYARNYYKCDLRALSHGKKTDHSPRWRSCARFEAGGPHKHLMGG